MLTDSKAPFIALTLLVLVGCVTASGSSVLKTYHEARGREDVAILRLDQASSARIVAIDGTKVTSNVQYILLRPGRHELRFVLRKATIGGFSEIYGTKFLEAAAGRTYIMRSETGWLTFGDKWFPDLVDATENLSLHIPDFASLEVERDE